MSQRKTTGLTTIYALCDPSTGEVRYIGKTRTALKDRLDAHMAAARRRTGRGYVFCWIRSLNERPVMRSLLVISEEFSAAAEVYAIAIYRSMGYRLTNLTAGGDGAPGYPKSPETRAKMSAAGKRRVMSPEARVHLSVVNKGVGLGRRVSAEPRAKMRAARLGHKASAETCARISVAKKGSTPWNKGNKGRKPWMNTSGLNSTGDVPWNKGKTGIYSAETLEKNRQAHLGKRIANVS